MTAEVRKVEKSPECNSLFLLFRFQSISHIVNILVSAIENPFSHTVFISFSPLVEVRLIWQSPVVAFFIFMFAICHVSSVSPSFKQLMARLNRHHSEIN